MKTEQVKEVFIDLAKQNLLISSESEKTMCLKDIDGKVVFSFELKEGVSTLTSLKCAIDDLKLKIDRAFKKK